MASNENLDTFVALATKIGATVVPLTSTSDAAQYIADKAVGSCMLPESAALQRCGLKEMLENRGCTLVTSHFREFATNTPASVTSANFAIADSGTLVLESTADAIRLATTLPEQHFVLFDPAKIFPDAITASPALSLLHQQQPANFVAYISGPSRTADIERVLTIGVHGPQELHILLVEGLSSNPLEA